MHEVHIDTQLSRKERYELVIKQIEATISIEDDLIANLANTAALLKQALGFYWIGFYIMKEEELVLGPFQGTVACTRIALDKGVCGAAASRKESILVADVDQFPGHIACSGASRSEIVVPLVVGEEVKMILDIDSDQLDDFTDEDVKYFEQVVDLLRARHYS